jgi:hypothetical protein
VKEKEEVMVRPLLRFTHKWKEQDCNKDRKGSGLGFGDGSMCINASRKCLAVARGERSARWPKVHSFLN